MYVCIDGLKQTNTTERVECKNKERRKGGTGNYGKRNIEVSVREGGRLEGNRKQASHAQRQCSAVPASNTNYTAHNFSLIPIPASGGLVRLITCHLEPATSDACVRACVV